MDADGKGGPEVRRRFFHAKVNGRQYLHLVKAIQGPRFLIGNNRGRTNGWITGSAIYGKCTKIGDDERAALR
jgi:hypothetical protein